MGIVRRTKNRLDKLNFLHREFIKNVKDRARFSLVTINDNGTTMRGQEYYTLRMLHFATLFNLNKYFWMRPLIIVYIDREEDSA